MASDSPETIPRDEGHETIDEVGQEDISAQNETVESVTDGLPPLPLCQVDRYWIQKLILRHQAKNRAETYSDEDLARVKIYASAPMVDQSDLPYRLQCRRYGTNICFTPMIHARMFMTNKQYRLKFKLNDTPAADRPLIAQLCGGTDPETMLQCALKLQDFCDGIDINCGCPQAIAKRGNYGAFLLEQEETLLRLVRYMAPRLRVPLSVKVRLLPEPDEVRVAASIRLYTRLTEAGIHLLTVHARTRLQNKQMTGAADWLAIQETVRCLGQSIPILANGSISSHHDVLECLQATKADGVMSSEAILEYPPLFAPLADPTAQRIGRLFLAREYLELGIQYPPDKGGQGNGFKCIRDHMHRFLHKDLQEHTDIRDAVVQAKDTNDLKVAFEILEGRHATLGHNPQEEELSWYIRHRMEESNCCQSDNDENADVENRKPVAVNQMAQEDEEENMGGWLF